MFSRIKTHLTAVLAICVIVVAQSCNGKEGTTPTPGEQEKNPEENPGGNPGENPGDKPGENPGEDSKTYVDLSQYGTANCYVVSKPGDYKFKAVKGNTDVSVGEVNGVEVLWESFGTSTLPDVGDIVASASFEDGYVCFSTSGISSESSKEFPKGNAVIAAKGPDGKILWSWHIWSADFGEQVYFNNAGTLMDRNLGAVSAKPGDVGCLGLMYQWGRKDPFMGAASISENVQAASTGTWYVRSESVSPEDLRRYLCENPTTFLYNKDRTFPKDAWNAVKTVNDPCPAGWRVPAGREDGLWVTASGSLEPFEMTFDATNYGINFSGKFGDDSMIWYPASGCLTESTGRLSDVGVNGEYWAASSDGMNAHYYVFSCYGYVRPEEYCIKDYGYPVRCIKE